MNEMLEKLKAPFDPNRVSFRVGATTKDKDKGIGLAYIDARDVMERLDSAVGPENWQDAYPHAGTKTVCALSIKIGDEWVTKSDGAGDTDYEATKGALSDAFKRAGVKWGIARYLYDMPNIWVPIQARGKSYILTEDSLGRLRNELRHLSNKDGALTIDPTQMKKSEVQAQKDFERLKEDLYSQKKVSHLEAWSGVEKDTISKLPDNFVTDLREEYRTHLQTLKQLEPPHGFDGSSDH